jgi:hypothetical protein
MARHAQAGYRQLIGGGPKLAARVAQILRRIDIPSSRWQFNQGAAVSG